MESHNTFAIILIVTVSTLISTPVESKCVPLRDSFVARSLLNVLPPTESESPSPAPASEVAAPINAPAASPNAPADSISPEAKDIDSPAPSPNASADSISPAENDYDFEAPSPNAPADSISPAEADVDSPTPSPNAPASSPSQTEMDLDSPVPSPDSITPSSEDSAAPGKSIFNVQKTVANSPIPLSPEIKAICGKTDNPALCESSVSPLVTPGFKADPTSVLILATQAAMDATKTAKLTVDKLNAPDCVELYDDAVANLGDAITAVKARDIPTVETNLSAAMTDYSTCNMGFEEASEPNPLADVAGKLTKMVSNCLAITALVK